MDDGAKDVDDSPLGLGISRTAGGRQTGRDSRSAIRNAHLRHNDRVQQVELGVPLIVVFHVFVVIARRQLDSGANWSAKLDKPRLSERASPPAIRDDLVPRLAGARRIGATSAA